MPPCSVSSMDCICSSLNEAVIAIAQSQNFKKISFASLFPVYAHASLKPAYILCTLYHGTHAERNAAKSPFCKVLHIFLLFGTAPTYPTAQSGLFFAFASWQDFSSATMYSILRLHSAFFVEA